MLKIQVILLSICLPLTILAQKKDSSIPTPECMEIALEGTQLVKSWGIGKTLDKAIASARLNAIKAVIYDGIHVGTLGCKNSPLIPPSSDQLSNEKFFKAFFKADYLRFVQPVSEELSPSDRIKLKKAYQVGTPFVIQLRNLKRYLEEQGIIETLTEGFK